MIEFVQKQLEASERLFNVMLQDHKERMNQATIWAEMNAGLMQKLDERDAEIERLRDQIRQLQAGK